MSEKAKNRGEAIPLWRALALLARGTWTEAAYGFGGPGVAETVGTPDEIGKELTRFLDGLERKNVETERFHTRPFAVQVEVEGRGGHETERFHTGRRGRPPIDSRSWPVDRAGAGAAGALLLARVSPRRPEGARAPGGPRRDAVNSPLSGRRPPSLLDQPRGVRPTRGRRCGLAAVLAVVTSTRPTMGGNR
jgi:hypothetical protein